MNLGLRSHWQMQTVIYFNLRFGLCICIVGFHGPRSSEENMAIAMLALFLAEMAEDLISYVFLVRLQIAAQRPNTFFTASRKPCHVCVI